MVFLVRMRVAGLATDLHAVDRQSPPVVGGRVVVDSAGERHEIHDDLVGHPDDGVSSNVRFLDLVHGVILEDAQSALDAGDVLGRRVYQKIDVFRRSRTAVGNHGEPADEDVTGASVVQRAADADEIRDLRLACVRAIVRVIHASASSKLLNR